MARRVDHQGVTGQPSPRRVTAHANLVAGNRFEALIQARARIEGMLAIKNELAIRYMRGGKMMPIRADLDFRILSGDGRVAYVDAKVRERDFFTWSEISQDQIKRAVMYNHHNVTSGFLVLFSTLERVAFFEGVQLVANKGKRMHHAQGIDLGPPQLMSLRRIFKPVSQRAF